MRDRADVQNLRKMGKMELMKLLAEADDRTEKLIKDNEKLQKDVSELGEQLSRKDRELQEATLVHTEAGTVAEEVFKINGVMESAQKAANQYVERIKKMHDLTEAQSENAIRAARARANELMTEARAKAAEIEKTSLKILDSLKAEMGQILESARNTYSQEIEMGEKAAIAGEAGYMEMNHVPKLKEILEDGESPAPNTGQGIGYAERPQAGSVITGGGEAPKEQARQMEGRADIDSTGSAAQPPKEDYQSPANKGLQEALQELHALASGFGGKEGISSSDQGTFV